MVLRYFSPKRAGLLLPFISPDTNCPVSEILTRGSHPHLFHQYPLQLTPILMVWPKPPMNTVFTSVWSPRPPPPFPKSHTPHPESVLGSASSYRSEARRWSPLQPPPGHLCFYCYLGLCQGPAATEEKKANQGDFGFVDFDLELRDLPADLLSAEIKDVCLQHHSP